MRDWLRKLFHHHEWTIIDRVILTASGIKVGDSFYLQCKHCGALKRKDL